MNTTGYNFIDDPDVEPLFKTEPPYTYADKGYMGVVLYHKKEDSLNCHICGEWVKHLPSHIWNKHNMSPRAYRVKYGLPLSAPLVAKNISESISVKNTKRQSCKVIDDHKFIKGDKNGHDKNNAKYARNCSSFQNKFAVCPKQLYHRYLIVADIVGKDPSEREILKYDSKLIHVIKNRYGSINKFKYKHNLQIYQFKTPKVLDSSDVLKKLNSLWDRRILLSENQLLAIKTLKTMPIKDIGEGQQQQISYIYNELAKNK